jgi:hypothetical protein
MRENDSGPGLQVPAPWSQAPVQSTVAITMAASVGS